jgi:hypothetical protein
VRWNSRLLSMFLKCLIWENSLWISNIKYQIVLAETELAVPLNGIALHTEKITPEILPLIELNQDDIDHIIAQIPGGIENVQDIYALSPLQDGILFHHLLAIEGDPYLLVSQMNFDNRALLDHYLAAMQRVIDRHDILRTAFVWERLSSPAQVVLRHSPLAITETSVDPGDGPVGEQLLRRFSPRHRRINLGQAPLQRFVTAEEADGSWHVLLLLHHLIADHSTFESMNADPGLHGWYRACARCSAAIPQSGGPGSPGRQPGRA